MSHEFESGFFVRQEAWHGLGLVLQAPPQDAEDALRLSEMDWEVELRPLYAKRPGDIGKFTSDPLDAATDYIETDQREIVRTDNENVMGYCNKQYIPYQNSDAFKWSEPLIESEFWNYETGISLREGQINVIILKQGEHEVIPGDTHYKYLCVMWGHNGKRSVSLFPTDVRVVCMNTFRMAFGSAESEGLIQKVSHRGDVHGKMDKLRKLWELSEGEFEKHTTRLRRFSEITVTEEQEVRFVNHILPMPMGKAVTNRMEKGAARERGCLRDLIMGEASGAKDLGVLGTVYNLWNSASEASEHYLFKRSKDRGFNILEGMGRRLNEKAFAACERFVDHGRFSPEPVDVKLN